MKIQSFSNYNVFCVPSAAKVLSKISRKNPHFKNEFYKKFNEFLNYPDPSRRTIKRPDKNTYSFR